MCIDGGLNAISGSQTVALAAKHYSVPLIVLGATYKLTPKFISASDKLSCSVLASPTQVICSYWFLPKEYFLFDVVVLTIVFSCIGLIYNYRM